MFHILVVEDDASTRKLMNAVLKQAGYIPFLAADGIEGLQILEQSHIDLILLDVMLGSGMVHPNVLRLNGYDDKKYKGFAFGIGIDRVAMLKYGIDDIKRFYTNDIDFIEQFRKE